MKSPQSSLGVRTTRFSFTAVVKFSYHEFPVPSIFLQKTCKAKAIFTARRRVVIIISSAGPIHNIHPRPMTNAFALLALICRSSSDANAREMSVRPTGRLAASCALWCWRHLSCSSIASPDD